MTSKIRLVLTSIVFATLVLAGCGGDEAPAAEPTQAAVLAEATTEAAAEATTEAAPAVTEEATEEATEAAPAETQAAEAQAFDVNSLVDSVASALPEGFLAMGKLDDVKAAIDAGIYLIDVREPAEYAEGHIPGAVNIPLRTLAQSLDKIPQDQPVLVYCASGLRAGTATAALRTLGFDNVKAFPGGWKAWTEANETVATDAVEPMTFPAKEVDPELLAKVDEMLSAIPEGFYSVGTVDKLQEAIDAGAVLVDVRDEKEFADGAIPNAINIPIRTLAQNLDKVPTDQPVIVYCASGHRAAMANAMLHAGLRQCACLPGRLRRLGSGSGNSGETPVEVAKALESDFQIQPLVDQVLMAIPEGFYAVGQIDAFKEAIDASSPLLIDVREANEYAEGHLPGAVNIPLRTLADNVDKIPADQPVFVYCASGLRAGTATAALHTLGFDNVKSFPGGFKAWSAAGEEVSTEPAEAVAVAAPKEVDPEALAATAEFLNNIPEGYYSVSDVEKLKGAIDAGAVVVDVREESEFAEGHVPGALNVPLRTLAMSLDQVPQDKPVVVYCASGHRAAMANAALHLMGYDNVRAFPAGYGAWEAAGEATE
ncbi:MAG: hypothetical protein IPK16_10160 [Anaerolineales bacterium]|nr:hypothetical protein [Anaerolineales bacterium]